MSTVNQRFPVDKYGPLTHSVESFMFLEAMRWAVVGPGCWEHPDYPMQHFSTGEALDIARNEFRRDCVSGKLEGGKR